MDKKKMAFIGETENGWIVEIPSNGKRWCFNEVGPALAKLTELVTTTPEVKVVQKPIA